MSGEPVTISVLGSSGKSLFARVALTFLICLSRIEGHQRSAASDDFALTTVSACHGAGGGDHPVSRLCYPSKLFEWWNKYFPHPQSEITNGAERSTDSSYFAYCSMHHLPDKTDLIILEFDAADPK